MQSGNPYDSVLTAKTKALLDEAENILKDGTGVLMSHELFKHLSEVKLLEKKTVFGFWDVPVLKTDTEKTIYIWPTLLGDEHYVLPPYARQMTQKS